MHNLSKLLFCHWILLRSPLDSTDIHLGLLRYFQLIFFLEGPCATNSQWKFIGLFNMDSDSLCDMVLTVSIAYQSDQRCTISWQDHGRRALFLCLFVSLRTRHILLKTESFDNTVLRFSGAIAVLTWPLLLFSEGHIQRMLDEKQKCKKKQEFFLLWITNGIFLLTLFILLYSCYIITTYFIRITKKLNFHKTERRASMKSVSDLQHGTKIFLLPLQL